MKNKESNKQNKKKSLILVLLLFVLVGIAGYGVYSYFYTSGSYSVSSDVSIASFDPEIDGDFLGNGGTLTLTCPDSATGNDTINCTGTLQITNNGNTDITMAVSDASPNVTPINQDSVSASAGTPTFEWEGGNTIDAGNTKYLNVTVPVSLSSSFGDEYSSVERDSAYEGESVGVTVSFKLTATQVHD